ncbi:MAG: TetR/AcrR family transcriptional regulator, partial [Sulfurimonas sp.]|nr:TetR/AcrR family transcriptional regulator [Sulfurimonas sp.]
MAIKVDKIQKRKDIALSCKKLFVNKSISELTIAQVAQTAGVGKGTIYEYFNNKEEIVFEVLNLLM